MYAHALPRVVEFDRTHIVTLTHTARTARVVAIPAGNAPLTKMSDLPFVSQSPDGRLVWWLFPKADSADEAELRGKFFWEEFVRYTRGTGKRRCQDASDLLGYILLAMPHYPDGRAEAYVFQQHLREAVIAHLRVGLR